jgi:hypothetical protein
MFLDTDVRLLATAVVGAKSLVACTCSASTSLLLLLPPKALSRPYKAPIKFSIMAISIALTVDGFSISQSLTSLLHDHERRAQARTAFSLIATPTIGTSEQTSPALFEQQTASKVNLDSKEDGSESSTPHGPSDLEKAETVDDERNGTSTGPYRAITSGRISRIQSLQLRRTNFEYPPSHVKTSADVLVDFDGPDDPYRPVN